MWGSIYAADTRLKVSRVFCSSQAGLRAYLSPRRAVFPSAEACPPEVEGPNFAEPKRRFAQDRTAARHSSPKSPAFGEGRFSTTSRAALLGPGFRQKQRFNS